jgi:hypothetical protein
MDAVEETMSSTDTEFDPLNAFKKQFDTPDEFAKSSTAYRKVLAAPTSNNCVETMAALNDCQ